MPLFCKKPVIVEAVQWDGENDIEVFNHLEKGQMISEIGKNHRIDGKGKKIRLFIKTLEGEIEASVGDWIIRGVSDEFYPCKPDIFIKTYEKI